MAAASAGWGWESSALISLIFFFSFEREKRREREKETDVKEMRKSENEKKKEKKNARLSLCPRRFFLFSQRFLFSVFFSFVSPSSIALCRCFLRHANALLRIWSASDLEHGLLSRVPRSKATPREKTRAHACRLEERHREEGEKTSWHFRTRKKLTSRTSRPCAPRALPRAYLCPRRGSARAHAVELGGP